MKYCADPFDYLPASRLSDQHKPTPLNPSQIYNKSRHEKNFFSLKSLKMSKFYLE